MFSKLIFFLLIAVSIECSPPDRLPLIRNEDIANADSILSFSKFTSSLTCDACKLLVKELDDLIQSDLTETEIVDIATVVCIAAKIESERVCRYGVREFKVRNNN